MTLLESDPAFDPRYKLTPSENESDVSTISPPPPEANSEAPREGGGTGAGVDERGGDSDDAMGFGFAALEELESKGK